MSLRMVLIIRIKYLGRKNGCMDITMLGTGSALVTECYNTCFVMSDGDEHFLVDGGGGNGILSQLKKAGFNWQDMRTDRKSTRLNSSHNRESRMPSSA